MVTLLYNLYLLITTKKEVFKVVGMQTDNTLFLIFKEFVTVTARTNASEPKLERMLYYEDTKLRSRRDRKSVV